MREVADRSESGAPAAGHAVRDLFSTDEIFHRLVATADEEFSRSNRLLFWSGLAAGLSIGLSFVACAAIGAQLSGSGGMLVANVLYPIGFLFIVLGRYQLFTENTLTPVTLVLTRIASIPRLLRIWGVVLAANVLGASICAFVLANTGVFSAEAMEVARGFGEHALKISWGDLFWKGVFAGWLVATMVWLTHAVRSSVARLFIVFVVMYIVPSAELYHCIIGAAEVLYLVFQGLATLPAAVFDFFLPVLLGNTVGGVLLVAILNYSQTRDRRFPDRDCGQLELTWREWLFGQADGKPHPPASGSAVSPLQSDDHVLDGHATLHASAHADDADLATPPHDSAARDDADLDAAALTLIQYGDYECPTSRRIYRAVRQSMEAVVGGAEDDASVRYVFRHLPLRQRHPHAMQAALAAEAAGKQGRFWSMHDRLFDHPEALEDAHLREHAAALGLDLDRFDADRTADDLTDRVMADRATALREGVRGTSNLFVGPDRFDGPYDVDVIERALRDALRAR